MATPVLDKDTIADNAVATKSAFPRPQPPRSQTRLQILFDIPPNAEKRAMMMIPVSNVFLMPRREETTPVINIATAITAL
ncbi:hypothetical protein D3C84_1130710 [compost metagenome]